uniref:putative glycosyltransferase 7 n=1 Tax=Erigeron canadensis TaxID=72917 RepID=UPI001CB92C82|nr:putative glycosyltransferase 7 [Erigeron canadensis]
MVAFSQASSRKPNFDRLSIFLAGAVSAFSVVFLFSTFDLIRMVSQQKPCNQPESPLDLQFDPLISSFYDDPSFGYTMNKSIKNWDEKRHAWLKLHPSFEPKSQERVFIVTGSQPAPCSNPAGDHFLLRSFRNKVDYCRIHNYDIFYNNVLLDPNMRFGWGKIPAVRAAMMAHPEAEWIWWLDEDTVITDIEFKLPLYRYKDYNFIVHGWPKEVYEKRSWVGLNAGSILIRNSQWSLEFLEKWTDMGPSSPNFDKWERILLKVFRHKSTDQTALAYLLYVEHIKWSWYGKKMFIETRYYLEGYWVDIVDTLTNITYTYLEIENKPGMRMLRRRHAEKVSEGYGMLREALLKDAGYDEFGRWRRPFVTHFAGCQPCNGKHNVSFTRDRCRDAMNKALSFADDQMLRNYGFVHRDLYDSSVVSPLSSI